MICEADYYNILQKSRITGNNYTMDFTVKIGKFQDVGKISKLQAKACGTQSAYYVKSDYFIFISPVIDGDFATPNEVIFIQCKGLSKCHLFLVLECHISMFTHQL